MNPGPELDRRIAEALGWEYAGYCLRGPMYYIPTGNIIAETIEVGVKFRPSTDWNDAMLAAEKAGLWTHPAQYRLSRQPYGEHLWDVYEIDWPFEREDSIATAPTGPHAICLAILKLLEKK